MDVTAELIKQLPISVAILLIFALYMRNNRDNQKETNQIEIMRLKMVDERERDKMKLDEKQLEVQKIANINMTQLIENQREASQVIHDSTTATRERIRATEAQTKAFDSQADALSKMPEKFDLLISSRLDTTLSQVGETYGTKLIDEIGKIPQRVFEQISEQLEAFAEVLAAMREESSTQTSQTLATHGAINVIAERLDGLKKAVEALNPARKEVVDPIGPAVELMAQRAGEGAMPTPERQDI